MIEDWLKTDHEVYSLLTQNIEDNKPLVIQADGGVGKKTLLNKWYEYHDSIKQ
jgi:guanylate kinase